jgi:hypothetical protein
MMIMMIITTTTTTTTTTIVPQLRLVDADNPPRSLALIPGDFASDSVMHKTEL